MFIIKKSFNSQADPSLVERSLNFFEPVNNFKKQPKANKPGQ